VSEGAAGGGGVGALCGCRVGKWTSNGARAGRMVRACGSEMLKPDVVVFGDSVPKDMVER
jgi:NAD-dependent SIR2 family protein deacetylase